MFAINKRYELLSNALHIRVAVLSLSHFNSNDFIQTIGTNRICSMHIDGNMLLGCPPIQMHFHHLRQMTITSFEENASKEIPLIEDQLIWKEAQ